MNPKKKKIVIEISIILVLGIVCVMIWRLGSTGTGEEDLIVEENREAHILTENVQGDSESENILKSAEVEVSQFAKDLYACKNPYIGDVSANGALLSVLKELYPLEDVATTELQTSEAPFWITFRFEKKPDAVKMWKMAAVFVALTDNCEEFRWSYKDREGADIGFYITEDFINEFLQIEDIKSFGESEQKVQELLDLLEQENDMLTNADKLSPSVDWDARALKLEMEDNDRKLWDARFIKDEICYRGDYDIMDSGYRDLDNNGQKDLWLLTSGPGAEGLVSMIYIYMNDDEVYAYPIYSVNGWSIDILTGDFDADERTELALLVDTGGNGGSGSYAKALLKYTGDFLQEMKLPGDFTEEERRWGDMGYNLNVSYAEGEGKYKVEFPALSDSIIVQSEYFKTSTGKYFYDRHPVGEVVGGECRGYFLFELVERDGREYLAAKEYTYKEGGINDGLGEATFLFDWDENGEGYVKEWMFEVH